MKYISLFICCLSIAMITQAQSSVYKVNPKAKKLDDSAVVVFKKCTDYTKCYDRVYDLLQTAVKIDPKWKQGWQNLVDFLGLTNQLEKCLVAAQKMHQLFPADISAYFNLGILQYKTGHKQDAQAAFNKVLDYYTNELYKNFKSPNYNDILVEKAIMLILCDKTEEGKAFLRQIYNGESDPYKKSYIAFYINKSKDEIIDDKIPGK